MTPALLFRRLLVTALVAALPASGAGTAPAVAADFALRGSDGTVRRLSEQRSDVVLLSFGGSGCGPCRDQQLALSQLQRTYVTAGLVVWVLAGTPGDGAPPAGLTVLHDAGHVVARRFRIRREPTLLMLDRQGAVRAVFEDYREGDLNDYLARLKPLLDE